MCVFLFFSLILVWLIIATLLRFVTVALGVRGPQGKVIPQQLHDQGGVFVGILVQGVQFGNRVIERLLRCGGGRRAHGKSYERYINMCGFGI